MVNQTQNEAKNYNHNVIYVIWWKKRKFIKFRLKIKKEKKKAKHATILKLKKKKKVKHTLHPIFSTLLD